MDWGSKTIAGTVTHRFWSAGPPATGDATPDATLTVTGGTPGTANQGTVKLSAGTYDLSGSGTALVPDVTDFATQGALGARVAEGRYVGSVPVAGSGNVRIVSVVADASGNLVATLSDGTTQSYAPGAAGVIPATDTLGAVYWTRQGNILTQQFFLPAAWNGLYVPFPLAFRAGTIPQAQIAMSMTPNNYSVVPNYLGMQQDGETNVTNLGFTFKNIYGIGGSAVVESLPSSASIQVMGEV